ncbi:MAG: small, acid-soluble spore protein, alpha/beta type [Desulfitobacteriia bacterium]|jgi:hypothetical protein
MINEIIQKGKEELIEELKKELGIAEEVQKNGWHSISPRVSGKLGGKLAQRLKRLGK